MGIEPPNDDQLIIDQVVMQSRGNGNLPMTHLWELVAIEFGLAIVSDSLNRAIMLMDGLLGDLFSNHTSIKIMTHAAILDLDQFEDSVFYDKLERARKQTVDRTVLLSQVMTQIQELITMGFLSVGLIAFNPWLILLLLVAVLPAFLGESYFNDRSYALTRGQTPERRELDYLRYIGVGFRYTNSEHWANRHLNFTLHSGEKLALVGENGAGKTTLVKLLARLYDPSEGRILLDGVDLKEYHLAELRMNIGIIFQDYLRCFFCDLKNQLL